MKYEIIEYCDDANRPERNVGYKCPECHDLFWGRPDICPCGCGVGFVWKESRDHVGDGVKVIIDQEDVFEYCKLTYIQTGQDASEVYSKYVCPNCGNRVTREQDHCDDCKAKIIWE